MTRKSLLILLPLMALAACGTPRERCISQANSAVSTLDRLITETRNNIGRGYALVEVKDTRVLRTSCEGKNADGSTFRFPCDETETYTRKEPVSINIAEERIKLAQLEDRRARTARDVQGRIQQCVALYPE